MQSHQKNKCVLFARGVNDHATNSIERQIERLRDFSTRRNFKIVDEVRVDQMSATRWKKEELDALVKRKQELDDFDLLLTADLSRFGRDGIEHLIMILRKFTEVGVTVLTLDNGVIDGSLLGLMTYADAPTFKDRRRRYSKKENLHASTKEGPDQHLDACADGAGRAPVPPRG